MGLLALLRRTPASVPNAPTGHTYLYWDSTNGQPAYKDDAGVGGSLTGTPATRQINTTGFLTGGGNLSADRTLSLTTAATNAVQSVINDGAVEVSILDYGGDPTGTNASDTALDNAIAALPNGGTVILSGTIRLARAPYIVSANNIELRGAGPNATILKTTATTGDQIRFTGYGCAIRHMSIQGPGTSTTSQKTSGIGVDMQSTEGAIEHCNFAYQYDAISIGGFLVDVDELMVRYFNRNGIVVNHNSDHRISRVTMDNAAATLPTGAGISVQVTASLVLEALNIIHSNMALDLAPASGVTVPSVKAVNCFFDTSAIGLNMTTAGSVFRSEFTNCWFSSMTTAGIRLQPASGGTVDGLAFVNCSIYNNVSGTTNGVLLGGTAGSLGKIKVVGSSIAGWTNGVNLAAAGTNFFPSFFDCTIGAISAFAVNTVGVLVAAGTYKGLVVNGCDVIDNTTNLTLGAVVVSDYKNFRILDNPGINPRGAVTTPTVPASTVAVTNTTGFRVAILLKSGATAPTVSTINGVSTVLPLASQIVTIPLDPGGTVQFTYTVAFTWTWVAN